MNPAPCILSVVAAAAVSLTLTSCETPAPAPAPAPPGETKPAKATFPAPPAVTWKIDTKEDAQGTPHSTVRIVVNGRSAAFATGNKLAPIDRANWPAKKIPADALAAVGGWWAGGGDYYYVKFENGLLSAWQGSEDEGSTGLSYRPMRKYGPGDFK